MWFVVTRFRIVEAVEFDVPFLLAAITGHVVVTGFKHSRHECFRILFLSVGLVICITFIKKLLLTYVKSSHLLLKRDVGFFIVTPLM